MAAPSNVLQGGAKAYQSLLQVYVSGSMDAPLESLVEDVMGVAATLQRRWEQAELHFFEAIDIATRAKMQPELGRTYFDHGRMLATRDERDGLTRASVFIKQSLDIFHSMNMQPFVYLATRFLERLLPDNDSLPLDASLYRDYFRAYTITSMNLLPREHASFLS